MVNSMASRCAAAAASPAVRHLVARHVLSSLACLGRHTLTGHISTAGCQFEDWTAAYRLFSRERLDMGAFNAQLRQEIVALLPPEQPLVFSLDDTRIKKCGKRTAGVSYQRDPQGPPFHLNLIPAQRFVQISLAFPGDAGAARMLPVDFTLAALPAKPAKKAAPEAWEAYRQVRRAQALSRVARSRLEALRRSLDAQPGAARPLICAVDGSYTNHAFLYGLSQDCTVIGRIRGDARMYHQPEQQETRGRRRTYGQLAPTPEQLLKDEQVPWQAVTVRFAGESQRLRVKTLAPLRWRSSGSRDLRLVVIGAHPYRVTPLGRTLYRKAAFIICTDPALPLEKLVQNYIWRWDIECNFRDEKTLLGIGEAQVRDASSVELVPALGVASYSILLAAALKLYGLHGTACELPQPKWRQKRQARATTQQMVTQLRHDLWRQSINFSGFDSSFLPHTKPEKFTIPLESALFYGAARA